MIVNNFILTAALLLVTFEAPGRFELRGSLHQMAQVLRVRLPRWNVGPCPTRRGVSFQKEKLRPKIFWLFSACVVGEMFLIIRSCCLICNSDYSFPGLYVLCRPRDLYTVSKNDTDVAHYNFYAHQSILAIFGRDVAERVCYQTVFCYPTSPN